MTTRTLHQIIPGQETSDGAGVKLRRSIGATPALRLDPFLMLDEFGTENPDDYIAGFPPHPHRGFETVTYMLDGHMRHQDHLGNIGELKSGGVQWMTAARGIIHSEMPQQDSGRMRGFQLWLNLPGKEKMKPASYRDIPASEIPQATLPDGGSIKVIAGMVTLGDRAIAGPVNPDHQMSTDPFYVDIHLPAAATLRQALPEQHNAFLYVYEGSVRVHSEDGARELKTHASGVLSRSGDTVQLSGGEQGARFILLAARPLSEPVVQYGPFVMNTREEIEQALSDYRQGRLAA